MNVSWSSACGFAAATVLACSDRLPHDVPELALRDGSSPTASDASPGPAYSATVATSSASRVGALGQSTTSAAIGCTQSEVAEVFAGDPAVRVRLVRQFHAGEPLALTADAAFFASTVSSDICLVKLNVGPGNPGPVGAPSTSEGIGIEVWLPGAADWKNRIHAMGASGFSGAPEISSEAHLGVNFDLRVFGEMALREGAVVSANDAGHVSRIDGGSFLTAMADGSFGLTPDGRANTVLWRDFSSRAVHETALKTKALVQAYYGAPAKFSYYEGCSNGGRQGLKEAQHYPDDFDGIVAGSPALYIAHAVLSMLYVQVAMLRDLGRPLTPEQLNLVAAAAVSACDSQLTGQHDGFITVVAACRYDPTRDTSVLCASDGGSNTSVACVTQPEASVINKIWYGPTADGSAPRPEQATGFASALQPGQIHFGFARGTALAGLDVFSVGSSFLGEPTPNPLATTIAAVILEDPAIASPDWWLPAASAKNGWKSLGYADFVELERLGLELSRASDDLETRETDLTQYRAGGGKIIQYHGTSDTVLPVQGSNMYYEAVAETMGGYGALQEFYRYYPVPGFSHCFGVGSANGRVGISPAADPPLPQLAPDNDLYLKLIDWVENGHPPENVTMSSSTGTLQRPLCAYPTNLTFAGGDVTDATRYACK